MSWFSVKSLYTRELKGKPAANAQAKSGAKSKGKAKRSSLVMVEERVVLFRARDAKDAIAKAEKDAKAYVKYSYENFEGYTVKLSYTGICETFELFESPAAGVEVYAASEVHKDLEKALSAADKKLTKYHGDREFSLRKHFAHKSTEE